MGRAAATAVRRRASARPSSGHVDLPAAARLCTALGRVETAVDVQPLLRDAAAILDATGLIVWVWHPLERRSSGPSSCTDTRSTSPRDCLASNETTTT